VNQRTQLEAQIQRWTAAGLLGPEAGARILAFEASHESRTSLRWPVFIALVFGGILVAAGVTLFVAAHWNELSPAERFVLVLFLAAFFHVTGAISASRFPALSATLHAVGTAVLGAAIFLTAQIFNLHENWATGILLWAVGAGFAYLLLGEWPQAGMVAILTPVWLISEWGILTEWRSGGGRLLAFGLILTALCYLSARIGDQENTARRTLVWIGGVALLPCVGIGIAIAMSDAERNSFSGYTGTSALSVPVLFFGWTVALLCPLALALLLRGRTAWVNLLWAAWTYGLLWSGSNMELFENHYHRNLDATLVFYALCALGSAGLVAWGFYEKRKERLNLGVLGFAISVLFFYFDNFMGKMGRSASLLILGILCLAGGFALELTRRKLTSRMEATQ
jgi:hypothetical protein